MSLYDCAVTVAITGGIKMMRARAGLILAVLFVCVAFTGIAQDFQYMATGGGPGFGVFMPDLAQINDFLSGEGFPAFEDNVFLVGGRGGVEFVPGPSLGGGGWGAWVISRKDDIKAEYGMGLGGFDLGYAIGGSENAVVSIGLMMGMGGADLTLTGNPGSPLPVPLGIILEPTEQVYNSVFLMLAPHADMNLALFDWAGIRLQVGYLWSPLSYDWHDAGLPDAPNLALDGLYVQASLVFGGIFTMEADEE